MRPFFLVLTINKELRILLLLLPVQIREAVRELHFQNQLEEVEAMVVLHELPIMKRKYELLMFLMNSGNCIYIKSSSYIC